MIAFLNLSCLFKKTACSLLPHPQEGSPGASSMSRTYVRWPGNHTLEPPVISFESNTSKWEGLSTLAPSFLRVPLFPSPAIRLCDPLPGVYFTLLYCGT